MQTFLPYESFRLSARCLDGLRLRRQVFEADVILSIITKQVDGGNWKLHPAVLMWKLYDDALKEYHNECLIECINRGYNMKATVYPLKQIRKPYWLGNPEFHLAYKSNLVRKYPEYYRKLWPNIPDDMEYMWPIS